MLYINKTKKTKCERPILITDFDMTLTSQSSNSSIGVFSKFLSEEYIEQKALLNQQEQQISEFLDRDAIQREINRLWIEKIKLLSKHLTDWKIIHEIVHSGEFNFREGAIESLKELQDRGVPIIVNSSGIGELATEILQYNGCDMNKLLVFSNYVLNPQNYFITPEQKYISLYQPMIEKSDQIVLMGDTIGDLSMIEKSTPMSISIGFLDCEYDKYLDEFNRNFDIVATNDTAYDVPLKKIKML